MERQVVGVRLGRALNDKQSSSHLILGLTNNAIFNFHDAHTKDHDDTKRASRPPRPKKKSHFSTLGKLPCLLVISPHFSTCCLAEPYRTSLFPLTHDSPSTVKGHPQLLLFTRSHSRTPSPILFGHGFPSPSPPPSCPLLPSSIRGLVLRARGEKEQAAKHGLCSQRRSKAPN